MNGAERSRRVRQLAIAGGLALALVVVAIVISQGGAEDDQAGAPAGETAAVEEQFAGIPQNGTVLGEDDAILTLVEFADLQCPFCRDFALEALPSIVDDYVRAGEVRLEFRPVSLLGPDSEAAAELAAAAALQDRLWELIDLFYRQQGTENSGYVTEAFLAEIAEATPGLDADAALEARGSAQASAILAEAGREFDALGLDSTPSFALGETGGRIEPVEVAGLDAASFTALLDDALARAGD